MLSKFIKKLNNNLVLKILYRLMEITFIPFVLSCLIIYFCFLLFFTIAMNCDKMSLNYNHYNHCKHLGDNVYFFLLMFIIIMLIVIKILKKFTHKKMKYLIVNGLAIGVLMLIYFIKPQLSFIIKLPLMVFQTFLHLKYEGTLADQSLNNLSTESMLLTMLMVPLFLGSNIIALRINPLSTILSILSISYLFRKLWKKFSQSHKKPA
jgi:hypothetical protein